MNRTLRPLMQYLDLLHIQSSYLNNIAYYKFIIKQLLARTVHSPLDTPYTHD